MSRSLTNWITQTKYSFISLESEVVVLVMVVKKVKICPQCGVINDEYAIYCTNPQCRGTLMNVDAVEVEGGSQTRPAGKAEGAGGKNGKGVQGKVGQDALERPQIRPTEMLAPQAARLEHTGPPTFVFKVKSGDTIGRAGDVDISALERSRFISGKHARFYIKEGVWQLESLAQTNKTYLNGVEIPPQGRRGLADGDMITMADSNFIFRVGC